MCRLYYKFLAFLTIGRVRDSHIVKTYEIGWSLGFVALAISFIVPPSAQSWAGTSGLCAGEPSAAMQVSVDETKGRATVSIVSPQARAGQMAHVDYDGETYAARFDDKGNAKVDVALVSAANTLSVSGTGKGAIRCDVAFPEIDQVYRVILRWHDPVRIDLHVIEPLGQEGGKGHVHAGAPNTAQDHGLGRLDIVTEAPEEDATGEQSYVIDEASRPPHGVFTFRYDYVSRGATPSGQFCEQGKFANVSFLLFALDHGKKQEPRKYATGAMACGQPLPHEVEFQRMK